MRISLRCNFNIHSFFHYHSYHTRLNPLFGASPFERLVLNQDITFLVTRRRSDVAALWAGGRAQSVAPMITIFPPLISVDDTAENCWKDLGLVTDKMQKLERICVDPARENGLTLHARLW